MKTHNFILGPVDTDSISFCKPDFTEFTTVEQNELLNEINCEFPELIKFDHDGYYKTCIVLKAKNYILQKKDGKITYKGSSLKDSKKEKKCSDLLKEIINSLLEDRQDLSEIYFKYCKEALNITDIKPWSKKITITEAVLNPERTNEEQVLSAIADTELKEGDKGWFFYDQDDKLKLVENFDGRYNKPRILKRLFDSTQVFANILDTKSLFPNLTLVRNKGILEKL